jgi:hypothetical protein
MKNIINFKSSMGRIEIIRIFYRWKDFSFLKAFMRIKTYEKKLEEKLGKPLSVFFVDIP